MIRGFTRKICLSFLILLGGAVGGMLLLTLAYLIPIDNLQRNVNASINVLIEEGAYPRLYGEKDIRMTPYNFSDPRVIFLNTRGIARDNITDAIMLNIAVFDSFGTVEGKNLALEYKI